jgi:hypothetical protein
LKKEILKILCNISSSDKGKELIVQSSIIPYLNRALEDNSVNKYVLACFANLVSCSELKKALAQHIAFSITSLQRALNTSDLSLAQYSFCFIENLCDNYPEAAYAYTQMSIMKHMESFFNTQIYHKLLSDYLSALYSLLSIKENM